MNLPTGLLLLAILVGGVLLVTMVSSPTSRGPQILAIEFPETITADGNEALGTIRFQDDDGDIVRAEFEVVEAEAFKPFGFDPEVRGEKHGSFQFAVFTLLPQRVTLEVTLIDGEGHRSKPKRFSFLAEMSFDFPDSGD